MVLCSKNSSKYFNLTSKVVAGQDKIVISPSKEAIIGNINCPDTVLEDNRFNKVIISTEVVSRANLNYEAHIIGKNSRRDSRPNSSSELNKLVYLK